ncbi:uncharacterized protein DUF2550 [Nocardioides sp. J9]|uniref:DUF2550 domain-containing protein n=1 Tax=unclassified Nocardioides TaxID=2615069 RepID=UPI00048BFCA4|nr:MULTISPECIES: DUF2550 domain-containing protein [unclassified Nocardioides]TWH01655.1 uncharacterized protein DUF2550 [Nocardioides sp. J9]
MAWWEWLLDVCGALLLLCVLYGAGLIVRRRLLSRHGGTFELSHRCRTDRPERGWVLGLGRYSGETLEWFRVFSLSPRPKKSWSREELAYDGRRAPLGAEQASLYPDHLVIQCQSPSGLVELAMSVSSLTGFQAWLEAMPPGTDWNRAKGNP